MKEVIVVVIGVLVGGSAWACGSYEECMTPAEFQEQDVLGVRYVSKVTETMVLKAIAYKLDEISEKLGGEVARTYEPEKDKNDRTWYINCANPPVFVSKIPKDQARGVWDAIDCQTGDINEFYETSR